MQYCIIDDSKNLSSLIPGLVFMECSLIPGLVFMECNLIPGLVFMECNLIPRLVFIECTIYSHFQTNVYRVYVISVYIESPKCLFSVYIN